MNNLFGQGFASYQKSIWQVFALYQNSICQGFASYQKSIWQDFASYQKSIGISLVGVSTKIMHLLCVS